MAFNALISSLVTFTARQDAQNTVIFKYDVSIIY